MPSTKHEEAPYQSFEQQNLLLRDYLALDRTALANERTLLAYIRTGLALLVVGGTVLHFFDSLVLEAIGAIFIIIAAATTVIGFLRFRRVYLLIGSVKRHSAIQPSAQAASDSADRKSPLA